MFYTIGTPRSVKELNTPKLRLHKVERKSVPILIIDDDNFDYLEHLKIHRFDITHFKDIESIESVLAYEIILCDIKGIGKKFGSYFEGGHIIEEIKKQYPFKTVIAYSAYTHDMRYNKFFSLSDFVYKKDISGDEWVEKLDIAINITTSPAERWLRIRNFLIQHEVPLISIIKLEDRYVKTILDKEDISTFNKSKVVEELPKDIRAILQSFTASIIFKLIFGN